jgi:hypothetical protein
MIAGKTARLQAKQEFATIPYRMGTAPSTRFKPPKIN